MLVKSLVHRVFGHAAEEPFAVEFPDGTTERYGPPDGGEPRFTVVLRDPHLGDLLDLDPGEMEMRAGEAYMAGRIDVRGDLADALALALRAQTQPHGALEAALAGVGSAVARAAHLTHFRRRSLRQQQQDIVHHYDLGNDFFRLWLDDTLSYSCAYFRAPGDTLERAQRQKLDHTLRKLRIRPGQTLLDIGSGWGALILRAAQAYGARTLGITLSNEQQEASCARIEAAGLSDRADVRLVHYDTLAREGRQFDRIVSVGMIEHVGKAHLPEFADAVARLLRPGGLALLHNITSVSDGPMNPWVDRYIFPGAYIPTIAEMISLYAERDLRILDVENLGPHYEMTLDCWSERFERNAEAVRAKFGEEFVRMWRLYLRGSAACFRVGTLELHQVLVSRGKSHEAPLTRDDLYVEAAGPGR